jgi:anti-sigma B factor antagonist
MKEPTVYELTDGFEMTVAHTRPDAPVVMELRGELDLHAAKILGNRVEDLLESGVAAMHVACVDVTFVDSAGLHALLHARRRAEQQGVGFAVVSMSERLRALVDLTATAELLPTA